MRILERSFSVQSSLFSGESLGTRVFEVCRMNIKVSIMSWGFSPVVPRSDFELMPLTPCTYASVAHALMAAITYQYPLRPQGRHGVHFSGG